MIIMLELINDPFYKLIEEYDRCVIDYCIMDDDMLYQGYPSHKDASRFAMQKVIERDTDTQIKVEIEKAQAHQIDSDKLLHVPEILRTDRAGRRFYDLLIS